MKMQDIADLAGVSIATISRVLNQPEKVNSATRQKVQGILDRTHFVANTVARGLVVNSMRTIGILANDISSLYIGTVVYILERRFAALGYNVILANTGNEKEMIKKSLKMILEKQVDGIIMVGSMYVGKKDNDHLIQAARKVPLMIVNNYLNSDNIYSVMYDDAVAVRNAVNYLVELGHRDIYYFRDCKHPAALAKFKGFQAGMREHDLNPDNYCEILRDMAGGSKGFYQLQDQGKRVTAIICGEDITAVGVMKAAAQRGLDVPGELSIIGYNNSLLTEVATPTLTSLDNHTSEVALTVAEQLYKVLQGEKVKRKLIFVPKLVVRESTAVPPEN